MTSFEDRERAFEAKWAHDQEFRFRVTARRDKLFAAWAAQKLALPEPDAASLAHDVIALSDAPGHDERVVDRIRRALAGHGQGLPRTELHRVLEGCAAQARDELLAQPPAAWH